MPIASTFPNLHTFGVQGFSSPPTWGGARKAVLHRQATNFQPLRAGSMVFEGVNRNIEQSFR